MIKHHHATPTPPARVVVLGSSGFVGSNLIKHLAELNLPTQAITSKDIDLRQPEAVDALQQVVQPTDTLVIISALTPDKGRDIRTLMQNLSMMEQVCAFLDQATLPHVVYISSDAVYEDEANPVRETSCSNPSSYHGLMHLAREKMLITTLQKTKVPLLILRPSAVYGAGDTHNSYGPNRFFRTALKDQKITLFGQGEEQRDHIYIKDLARLIGLGILHGSEGVLNVVTGTAVSFMEIAQLVAKQFPDEVAIECLPRSGPITHRHFDITETLKAFPTFTCIPIDQGLAETYSLIGS